MNVQFPPLVFQAPLIRPYRQGKRGFVTPPALPTAERRENSSRVHREIAEVQQAVRRLTPEQRRTVFLKLRHNRPLTQKDIAATGLVFMGASGAEESLVVSRDEDFHKLENRIVKVRDEPGVGRPAGTDLVYALEKIELGKPRDRLSQELLDNYEQLKEETFIIYEIEVSSFKVQSSAKRAEVEATLREIHQNLARIHGAVYEHELLDCGARAVLWTTGAKFQEFVENERWQRKITWFDARPKFLTAKQVFDAFNVGNVTIIPPGPSAETICVIDSGVARANPFLEPVVRLELSRSFVYGCSADSDAQGHGSAVASLAAYYHIDSTEGAINKAGAFVASARIMTDGGELDSPREEDVNLDRVNQARLLSTILRELVAHFHARGVRIFVLSFEMCGHIYSHATRRVIARNAWIARTIDELSREYDVIFVNITGNLSLHDTEDLHGEDNYPDYLVLPYAKLLDPGPAALAITVGSVAHSARTEVAAHTALALEGQPSPFTRSGPGFGDSKKPDFVERGGNLVRDSQSGRILANGGTNVIVATGQLTPALQRLHGTSFAAPRVAYQTALLLEDLKAAGVVPGAPLLRAFLASSAKRPEESEVFADEDDNMSVLGFGIPSSLGAVDCKEHSVILYWQGEIPVDNTAIFRVHVPVDLALVGRGKKRITVALATSPRVQRWGLAEYLGAEVQFRLFRGDRDPEVIQAALQRESTNEENKATATEPDMASSIGCGINRRSFGTLQKDVFEWSDHRELYSAHDYTLAVTLRKASWEADAAMVQAAVVVRLEDDTGRCQTLYAKVRAAVQARVRA